MKLKELHIRNIASIEQADIDFEKDLNDAITGDPASIFLISGDTGAGKSVILDGISMALYKKTPRIADVANVTKNEFTDTEGESIRVASIEQYTRLGISEKDDSYSEVVFEGNDGKTYHARLTLGIMLGNKDKTTGIRPLKHKSPVWEIRVEDGDWTKDSVEQTIQKAIGLDFQQFGRMAMLAQGQFANFLTGDKKEREAILEQLTNTQHFTEYGEAIQSLWKKAKETQKTKQTQYETEKPHTLDDDEVKHYTNEKEKAETQIKQCGNEIDAIDKKLEHVRIVRQNEETQNKAVEEINKLIDKTKSDEYRQSKALIIDWDATTSQRQQLTTLIKARQDETDAKKKLSELEKLFHLLTADLADREEKAKKEEEAIDLLQSWVDDQARYDQLYKKAGETDLKIDLYLKNVKKAEGLSNALNIEKGKTKGLEEAESEAKARANTAKEAVEKKQDEIDKLNGKLNDLNLQEVNTKLEGLNNRNKELSDLQTSIDNLKPVIEDNQNLKEKLQTEKSKLDDLLKNQKEAYEDYTKKKDIADKATQRLTTMNMSLDNKIKELRHRLYEEHTENCPLCGQHIEQIHLDDDFKGMLTPLQEEEEHASKDCEKAEKTYDNAKSDYDKLHGTHETNKKTYETNKDKIDKAQNEINKKALALKLDTQKDLSEQIAAALDQLQESITKLKATQSEAVSLQKEINRLIEEKQPLDTEKNKAVEAKLKAKTAVKTNADEIIRVEGEHRDLTKECESIKADINTILADYCNNWLADIKALRKQLRDDAGEYSKNCQRLKDNQRELKNAQSLIGTLTGYKDKIIRSCPKWETNGIPQTYACSDINTEWTNLLSKVSSLVPKLRECNTDIVNSERKLAAYYKDSGKTEESLKSLIDQESQVAAARELVQKIVAELKSRNDAITYAKEQIKTALKELGITDRAELPDQQSLDTKRKEIDDMRGDAIGKKAEAESKLKLHEENSQKLKAIESELKKAEQRFARWDRLNSIFGGTRFRTLVQTYILRPLLNNANIYLEQITDRYHLTCSEDNEQLSILVLDRYNKNQVRSVTVLSGGERFMISLALSLALSSLNRPDMNVNILFIDEGFGTLDEKSLDSVMQTLEKLQEIAGQTKRRVGIISHREELDDRIPVKIQVEKKGEGRSHIKITNALATGTPRV